MSMLTLYHFTNREAWTDIVLDGEIRPSGKSLDRKGGGVWPAHNAPDIVWMTTNPTPGWCCERSWHGVEQYPVRFTLRLPAEEVCDLWTWATRHKVFPDHATWRPSPEDEGGDFRCIERPVMAHTEWTAINDMHRDGLCSGAIRAQYLEAQYLEEVASRPVVTPDEVAEGLVFLVRLRDALRSAVPSEFGANSSQSKEAR